MLLTVAAAQLLLVFLVLYVFLVLCFVFFWKNDDNSSYLCIESKEFFFLTRFICAFYIFQLMMICFSYQQLSTNSVRDDLKVLQQRLEDRNQAKLDHIEKEKEAMMSKSTELRVAVEELEGGVMDLQSDNEQVAQETKYCVTEIGRQQGIDEDERNDIVRSLMAEKAVLESAIVGLQQKLQDQRRIRLTRVSMVWTAGQARPRVWPVSQVAHHVTLNYPLIWEISGELATPPLSLR